MTSATKRLSLDLIEKNTDVTDKKAYAIKFCRDKHGALLDLSSHNGQYSETKASFVKCKYMDEVRFCFGVGTAIPLDTDGNEMPREGRRAQPYNYTGKTLLTIPDYEKRIQDEIQRVKSTKHGESGGWVVQQEGSSKVYIDDPLTSIAGVGKKTAENFTQIMYGHLIHLKFR